MSEKYFDRKYAEYYDKFNSGKDYSKEVDYLENIFKQHGILIKDILNLGCGTGVHDALLACRDYNISGLDLSEEMIQIARSKNIPRAKYYIGDMSKFQINKRFDACLSMFAAFGYLNSNQQVQSCLKCVNLHLKNDGLFVMDCWNGLGVLREPPTSRTKKVKNGNLEIIRTSYPELDSRNHLCHVKFDVQIYKDSRLIDRFEENHTMRYFFPKEIEKYISDGGFKILDLSKDFRPETKLDENDWNFSLVARKIRGI
jgi:SAM-dependent methyltransferase